MRFRSALGFGVVCALATMAAGSVAAPPVLNKPILPDRPAKLPVAPAGPAAVCLTMNPDQRVDLGSDPTRTVTTNGFPDHAGCDAFIADFEAGLQARGANVRPAAPAPQSWLDAFSLSIWESRQVPGGDSLKLTTITNAKLCGTVKQSLHVYRKVVPTESTFTFVAGGELKPEWSDGACWLRRPFTFRGQPSSSATTRNVYRLVFTAPGAPGPITTTFRHDSTSNGE